MELHAFLSRAIDPSSYHWNWNAVPKFVEASVDFSLGLFVFFKNPRSIVNRSYLLFSTALSFWLFCYGWATCVLSPQLHNTICLKLGHVSVTLIAPATFLFISALLGLYEQRKRIIFASFILGAAYYVWLALFEFGFDPNSLYYYSWGPYNRVKLPYLFFYPFFFGLMIWAFVSCWLVYRRTSSTIERNRIRYVLLAIGVAYTGSIDWLPAWGFDVYPIGYLSIFAFDLILAYTIVSQKLFDIRTIYLRTAIWAVTSILVFTPLVFVFSFLDPWLRGLNRWAFMLACFAFFTALAIYAKRIQAKVDELFQRRRYNLDHLLLTILPELFTFKSLDNLVEFLNQKTCVALVASKVTVFLCDKKGQNYFPAQGASLVDPVNESNDSQVFLWELFKHDAVILKEELNCPLDDLFQTTALFAPLFTEGKPLGFIAVGPRLNDHAYHQEEKDFLNKLRNSSAAAVINSVYIRKAVELEKLIQSTQAKTIGKLETALGAVTDCIVWVDVKGLIQWCNSSFNHLIERHQLTDVLGANLMDLLLLKREGKAIALGAHPLNLALTQKEPITDIYEFHRQGKILVLEVEAVQRLLNQDEIAVILTLHDITAQKQAEQALHVTIHTLKETQAGLIQSEKMAAIGQLAAGVAHEINNPLGVILGFSQSITKRITTGDPLEMPLKSIEREALRAKQLIQDLLTFSRVAPTETEELDINEMIQISLSVVLVQAKIKNTQLVEALAPNLPKIFANKNRIQQVMINLANNAMDAMPNGGTLKISTKLSTLHEKKYVEIQIQDTGFGIPKEVQPKIFEPFFTTKEVGQGTGLGLSLVFEIIQKYQGYITVYSEPGQGTLFQIYFPARE